MASTAAKQHDSAQIQCASPTVRFIRRLAACTCPVIIPRMSIRTSLLLTSLALCLAAGSAHAEMSLQQAIEKVQRDTGGKVLSAEPIQVGKKKIYRIKVLTRDGQVRVIQVTADDN